MWHRGFALSPGQSRVRRHPTAGRIQALRKGRVATATMQAIFGPKGTVIMAAAIIISTFGCNNGLILAGTRVYYAMAPRSAFFAKWYGEFKACTRCGFDYQDLGGTTLRVPLRPIRARERKHLGTSTRNCSDT